MSIENEVRENNESEELIAEDIAFIEERNKKRDDAVEGNFGKEMLQSADHLSESLEETLKTHLLSSENPQEAEKTLQAWREFMNRAYQRIVDANKSNPEMVRTVLETAAAMMQPEADNKGADAVKRGIKIIKGRYGEVK